MSNDPEAIPFHVRFLAACEFAGLNPAEALAALAMMYGADPHVSTPEAVIAARSVTSIRTVRRAKAKLRAAGLISRVRPAGNGKVATWDVSKLCGVAS